MRGKAIPMLGSLMWAFRANAGVGIGEFFSRLFRPTAFILVLFAAGGRPIAVPGRSARHRQGSCHIRLPAGRQLPHSVFLFRRPQRPGVQGAVAQDLESPSGKSMKDCKAFAA